MGGRVGGGGVRVDVNVMLGVRGDKYLDLYQCTHEPLYE